MSYQVMKQIKTGYIECMLWADSPSIELGYKGLSNDLDNKITKDIELFIKQADKLIDEALETENYYLDNIGHDFWLTRNGHGSGFWDGVLSDQLGDRLSTIAESFKTFNLWIDNNQLQGEQI